MVILKKIFQLEKFKDKCSTDAFIQKSILFYEKKNSF